MNALCLALSKGLIKTEKAIELLDGVQSEENYPQYIQFWVNPVASFCLCALGFGGSWLESVVAASLGILVSLLMQLSAKNPSAGNLLEFSASFLVTFLARALQNVFALRGLCYDYIIVTLSSIATLLPGLTLTVSIMELATRNMTSGTVRLFLAIFTSMLLGEIFFINNASTLTNLISFYVLKKALV